MKKFILFILILSLVVSIAPNSVASATNHNFIQTNKFAADMGSAGTVAGGGALLLTWLGFFPALPAGLGSAYFHLMGSRASANNKGKGIHIKFWWTLAYKFSPHNSIF